MTPEEIKKNVRGYIEFLDLMVKTASEEVAENPGDMETADELRKLVHHRAYAGVVLESVIEELGGK
jgi:LPS O-antigen subunit length determinant protein (WzzB/FepE family)